jgi:ABC-type polysaccharide/polyol phosphate transport system ATPase subunit
MLVSHLLQLRSRTRRSSLWALRGASFDVRGGECVGVVGRNGSGKSTLLHLLAGVTAPTEGRVTVRGRVAPLISVGVGFHPELTGRENVYVNATILGLTRDEIDRRFDDIVAFAEIGDFLDTPVKFYSSGMFVRLGFAVSAMAEPDVVLIDEVLAVGDLAFQLKCFDRLERLRESGATVVLVTHNLNAVRRLCERTLVIHNGEVRHDGETVEGLSLYHELLGEARDLDDVTSVDESSAIDAAELTEVRLLGADGQPTRHAATGEQLTVEATITVHEHVADPVLGISIVTEGGLHAYGESWPLDKVEGWDGTGPLRVRLSFPAALATGSYSVHVGLASLVHARIAPPTPPVLFYVTGRLTVQGVADLKTELTTD